jgi:hypothetical protein
LCSVKRLLARILVKTMTRAENARAASDASGTRRLLERRGGRVLLHGQHLTNSRLAVD